MATLSVGCSAAGCDTTSARGEYDSMTLRIGFSGCCQHLSRNEVETRVDSSLNQLDESMITVIFYNIRLSKDGQVEQLTAFSFHGDTFSTIVKTTLRANTSSTLRDIPNDIYNALSSEPKDAMERFTQWIIMTHSMNTGNTDMRNIVLTAHFGSCHDHIYLLRAMMGSGIKPLNFKLADSLALFKTIMGPDEPTDIALFIDKYAKWLLSSPNFTDNDAWALRVIVMTMFPRTNAACYTFSISCQGFMERTGLNMLNIGHLTYTHYPMWDGAIICEESGKLIGWQAGPLQSQTNKGLI